MRVSNPFFGLSLPKTPLDWFGAKKPTSPMARWVWLMMTIEVVICQLPAAVAGLEHVL